MSESTMSMAPNPLIAGPLNTSTPFTGTFLLEDGEALCSAIKNQDWISGGMAIFSGVMDAVAAVSDPIGTLFAMGFGWIMEHVEPLRGWLNELTGDAGAVGGYAQTWRNVSVRIQEIAASLNYLVGADLAEMKGQAIEAYRTLQRDVAKHLEGAGQWADAMATGYSVCSTIVQMVHDITRDAIAEIAGALCSYAIEAVATLGLATPLIIEQAATRTASLATSVGKRVTALLESSKQLKAIVESLQRLLKALGDKLGVVFRNADAPSGLKLDASPTRTSSISVDGPSGGATVRGPQGDSAFPPSVKPPMDGPPKLDGAGSGGPDGSIYSVAYQMELDPSDWAQSRKVHFNRANADLDAAIKSDPRFAKAMETLSPGVGTRVESVGGRRNPNPADYIWNHAHPDTVGGKYGVMQLVPTYQHTPGSIFWTTIHPGYRGGFAIWGGARNAEHVAEYLKRLGLS